MYGKIFDSIYDGTLVEDWRALVTFQQLIVLCDADGVIDMTPSAISRRTGIPIEHIKAGIEVLERPDPWSRTPDEEGRRIIRLDEHRPWGWYLVNHKKYKALQDADTVREQNRIRKQRQREKGTSHNKSQNVTDGHGSSRHTDTDTDTDTDTKNKNTLSGKPDTAREKKLILQETAKKILQFLNEKTGRNYQPVNGNLKFIIARLKDGATEAQCRQVIARKCREWQNRDNMAEYIRPKTLFNETNFANYVGELGVKRGDE